MRAHARDGVDTTTPPPAGITNKLSVRKFFAQIHTAINVNVYSLIIATMMMIWLILRQLLALFIRHIACIPDITPALLLLWNLKLFMMEWITV